ncbi:MAG: HEAT repeat domain-containing protein [Pirellulaceae bacterium]
MSSGLATTLATLAATDNEAAVALLLAALDVPDHDIHDGAMQALLTRRSPVAAAEILRRWDQLSPRWKQQVAQRGDWIAGAVRKALLDNHDDLHRIGCEAAIETRDYDAIPLLVAAAAEGCTARSERAGQTALQLAELLSEEVSAPRDYRNRRDPQLQRAHVLVSLEKAACEFHQHGRRELLEAFLLLASRENAALKHILQSPADRNFGPLVEVLGNSPRAGLERLLLLYLDDPFAPLAALQVMVRRRDVAFLRRLLRKIGPDPAPVVRMNLKRIENVPWMQVNLSLLDALSDHEQPGAVQLAALSGMPRQLAFEAVAYLLRHGALAGRRAAAQALDQFNGPAADDLVVRTLEDADPQVRAAAAAQLRRRGVPGAIQRLLGILDSPHQVEREAAQGNLTEFTFARFLAAFESLGTDIRRVTGRLVRQIDPDCLAAVRLELNASARSRRKRALELVQALGAVEDLEDEIAAMLSDEDQFLRIEAIRVLASSDRPRARQTLRDALIDPHPLVQEAAEVALAERLRGQFGPISENVPTDTPPPDTFSPIFRAELLGTLDPTEA